MPPPLSSPAPGPRWAVLRCKADDTDADLPRGAGCLARVSRPPVLTELLVSPLVDGASGAPVRDPYVIAADPSGVLLLCGSTAGDPERTAYFLCDAVAHTVRQLPDTPNDCAGAAGLLVPTGGGGDVMVAELVWPSTLDAAAATLHCFSPDTGGPWIRKTPRAATLPPVRSPWCSDRALSYMGKLWWVDLSQGLLACDPSPAQPDLHFVRFPNARPPTTLAAPRVPIDPRSERCVALSAGKLRYTVLTTGGIVPRIKLWTLADPDAGEWTLDHKLSFRRDIWSSRSYGQTGLLNRVPALGLVHPGKPQVVYIFEREHLYGFDMRVKEFTEGTLAEISRDEASSAFLLAWELPPSLQVSGPVPTEDLRSRAFDRLAAAFGDACDAAITAMEFE
ncbi:hypothetical protein ACP70R_030851 [Stipagrostis hirtigluma subsp. patula]